MKRTLLLAVLAGTLPAAAVLAQAPAGKLDLDRMITRRIKIDEINDALRAMERGEVVRQVIEF